MLSAENQALCQRDRAIAGLEAILQPDAVLKVFQTQGLTHAHAARLDYLRYKPSRRCIGLFEIGWSSSNSNMPTILVATAMTKTSWEKFIETRAAKAIEQGAMLLPEQRLALEWFPNDHGLKNAAKIMSLASRPKVLRRILQVAQLESVELNTLSYKPARRHVASCFLQGKQRITLKTYTSRGFADADWRIRLAIESGLSNCQVLGSSSHYSSIATSWIEGRTLSQWMLSAKDSLSTLSKVGAELAAWHARGQGYIAKMPATNNLDRENVSLMELADDIAVLAPSLAVRAWSLAKRLTADLSAQPKANDLIHGDFYAKQVILDPSSDRVHFIDFDQLRLGDRYEDIANFVAKNYWQVIHEGLNEPNCESANQQFLEGYTSQFGPLDRDRLRLHVSIALFRCAPHAFRRVLPNWTNRIESLLEHAERWLTTTSMFEKHLPTRGSHNSERYLDISQVNAAWTDRSADIAVSLKASTITSAKLLRLKPGRRLLVEYKLTKPNEADLSIRVLGKARLAKGIDTQTPQLHKQLLNYNWGDSELKVPMALGLLPTLSMWLQECVEGDRIYPSAPLKRVAKISAHYANEDHARVGRALADFHSSRIHIDRSYSVTNEVEKLSELFADLVNSQPELKESLVKVEGDCRRIAESLPSSKSVPIHRDFYFDQVLVSRKHVYLLDLDMAAMGPPELDVGNYLAHLDEYSIRFPSEEASCQKAAEAFLERYLERSTSACIRSVRIWRHLSLARHIALSARIDGRSHTTLPLIERVLRFEA